MNAFSTSGSRVLVALLALGALTTLRESPHACTPVPVPIGRSSNDVFFIGDALPDTVLAGAGDQEWGTGPGHSGFGRPREIYGQQVHIEQLRGLSATRLPAETKTVVLVPWDYGADCSTVVWGKSARWVAPGARAVFNASLRPRDRGTNDLPTLDVSSPEFSLYPFDVHRLYMLQDTALNDLSLEDVLDLYERLPLDSLLRVSPDSAIQPLQDWARSKPALAARQPARTILDFVRFDAEERRVSMIRSPIAGTYRFVITVPHVDSLILYARTTERPLGAERRDTDFAAIGYSHLTAWASSTHALPGRADRDSVSSSISISLMPVVQNDDSSVWHGSDGILDRLYRERSADSWHREAWRLRPLIDESRPKDWHEMPGFWTIYRDGTVRYRYVVERDGAVVFSIVGERISSVMLTRLQDQR